MKAILAAILTVLASMARGGDPPDLLVGVRFFEERVKADPDDFLANNQLGERCLVLARATGKNTWLVRAGRAANESLRAVPENQNPGGLALRARVDLAEHRFAAARDRAQRLRELMPAKALPSEILADALLELGNLDGAEAALAELTRLEDHPVNLSPRRARLAIARGQLNDAREHFRVALEAARTLMPPSPLTVAWCEVQLGELAFRTGDWIPAEDHYNAALEAVPDWWSAREHLAELRGAQAREAEALELYEKVIAATSRPEIIQSAGDLCLFVGRKEDAQRWHDRARAAYLAAVEKGGIQYYHHLAGFYGSSQPDAAEALKWARKDLELRQSAQAHDALAWALYKNGDLAAAAEAIAKALATGVKDAHLFHHAGLIRLSAGDVAGGQAALREAAAINPYFQAFHAHR